MLQADDSTIESIADALDMEFGEVEGFLRLSTERQVLYHGVKKIDSIPRIEQSGILPLTPESKASHWTSGVRTFTHREGPFRPGSMATYDTPWFCYSTAALVITDYSAVKECWTDARWANHGELAIPVAIPRQMVTIFQTTGHNSRNMFDRVLQHLHNYSRGKTFSYA